MVSPVRALVESPDRSKAKIPGTLALCNPYRSDSSNRKNILNNNYTVHDTTQLTQYNTYWMSRDLLIVSDIICTCQAFGDLLSTLKERER